MEWRKTLLPTKKSDFNQSRKNIKRVVHNLKYENILKLWFYGPGPKEGVIYLCIYEQIRLFSN